MRIRNCVSLARFGPMPEPVVPHRKRIEAVALHLFTSSYVALSVGRYSLASSYVAESAGR